MSLTPRIISVISHPKRFFSEKSFIFFSKFRSEKENRIKTARSVVKRSHFTISGKDNQIDIGRCVIYNTSIYIRGTGNRIIIEDDTRISNMHLTIKATNSRIRIGNGTHLGGGVLVCCGDSNYIDIGCNCMISEDVDIWNSDSHTIFVDGTIVNTPRPIEIGNHVWLGKGVAVLKGVKIGDNAVVGMRSLVTKSIRPNTINAGSPAHEIGENANWQR